MQYPYIKYQKVSDKLILLVRFEAQINYNQGSGVELEWREEVECKFVF